MACKEGQLDVIEIFSINLNAQHVNGMTQNLGGWNLISEFLLCEARFDRWENRVMRCFSVEFKV